MDRFAPRIASLAVVVALAFAPVTAHGAIVDTAARDASAIRARWEAGRPLYTGTPYATAPSTVAPFAAGTLRPEFLDDGLRAVNFMRYLAGLPDDVALSADYTARNQAGSVINAANGVLDHSPTQPAGMSDSFHALGTSGTSSSNLAWGPTELEKAVKLYMTDSDAGNISHLGHRRWILNPPMAKTGFGQAGLYSSMWAFDRSRVESVDYNAIAWPAAGPFPVEFFSAGTAWSITLDPAKYSVDPSQLRIALRRVSDGRTWTFTSADTPSGPPGDGEYLTYNSARYGVPSCIIFRPPLDVAYAPGESFDVTVSAGVTSRATSRPAVFGFRTTFMSLAAVAPVASSVGLASPSVVVYSRTYGLGATLTRAGGSPIVGKPLLFELSRDGGQTWSAIGAALTDASGRASLSWTPTSTRPSMRVRARWAGETGTLGSQMTRSVIVKPYVRVAPPSAATAAKPFSVTGYVRPRHAVGTYPASVRCYRRVNGAWVYKTSFRAKVVANGTATSRLRANVTLGRGTWLLKLYHAADRSHAAAYSAGGTVSVR